MFWLQKENTDNSRDTVEVDKKNQGQSTIGSITELPGKPTPDFTTKPNIKNTKAEMIETISDTFTHIDPYKRGYTSNFLLTKWQSTAEAKIGLGLYLNDVEQYPLLTASFAGMCYRNSVTFDDIDYKKSDISRYYFNEALSYFCDDITGIKDPFWILLKLARQGDRAIQLALPDELISAIKRNTIEIYAQPMEYMYIRDEIIDYLEEL